MTSLNQIIAIAKTKKSQRYAEFTAIHHELQKTARLSGISRTYRPIDDEGDQLPPEYTKVQLSVETCLDNAARILTDMFDTVATQDWANCEAKADIIIDGQTIVADVPVTYLLFLEKQLTDMITFLKELPILDPSEQEWVPDPATNTWKTQPYQTIKTKKISKPFVKFAGDEHHAPQIDVVHDDVIVGHWTTVKYSGAIPAQRSMELVGRAEKLHVAVKYARERANMSVVKDQQIGSVIFKYLLRG